MARRSSGDTGFLDFREALTLMDRHNFAATIAFHGTGAGRIPHVEPVSESSRTILSGGSWLRPRGR
jgi:hypothetical protein